MDTIPKQFMKKIVKHFEFEGELLPYIESYVNGELKYSRFTYRGNSVIYKPCEYVVINAYKKAITIHEYHVINSFLLYMYNVS